MKRMTLSKFFLDAAEAMQNTPAASDNGACNALWQVYNRHRHAGDFRLVGRLYDKASDLLERMYAVDAVNAGPWGSYWGKNFSSARSRYSSSEVRVNRQAKLGRVLMLLFLAEMTRQS